MSLRALRDPMNEVILRLRMEGSSIKSEQELEDFLRSVSALSKEQARFWLLHTVKPVLSGH